MSIFPEWAESKKLTIQIYGINAILLLAVMGAPEWAYIAVGGAIGAHSYAQGRVDEK